MALTWDLITFANLVLCVVIVILGIIGYQRKGSSMALSIGIAFGLFGISHLVSLLGYRDILETALIWIRTLAYLIVGIALVRVFTE